VSVLAIVYRRIVAQAPLFCVVSACGPMESVSSGGWRGDRAEGVLLYWGYCIHFVGRQDGLQKSLISDYSKAASREN